MSRYWITLFVAATLGAALPHRAEAQTADGAAATKVPTAAATTATPKAPGDAAATSATPKSAGDAKSGQTTKATTKAASPKPAPAGATAGAATSAAAATPGAATATPSEEEGSSKKVSPKKMGSKPAAKRVSLNSATSAQLKALPGGSDEEAARIIAGRPYNSKAFLVTNKIVTEGRYFQIKDLVEAGAVPKTPKEAAPKK